MFCPGQATCTRNVCNHLARTEWQRGERGSRNGNSDKPYVARPLLPVPRPLLLLSVALSLGMIVTAVKKKHRPAATRHVDERNKTTALLLRPLPLPLPFFCCLPGARTRSTLIYRRVRQAHTPPRPSSLPHERGCVEYVRTYCTEYNLHTTAGLSRALLYGHRTVPDSAVRACSCLSVWVLAVREARYRTDLPD